MYHFYDATHLVIVLQFSWKLTLTQIDVSRNVGAAKKSRDAQLAWSSCLRSSSSEGAKCKLSFLLTLKVWSKFNKVLINNKANLNLVWTTSQCSKSQKKSHSTLRSKRAMFTFWQFPPIFVLLKLTCLVTLMDHFWHISLTQNVNVARSTRNFEWDFFCDFVILWFSVATC